MGCRILRTTLLLCEHEHEQESLHTHIPYLKALNFHFDFMLERFNKGQRPYSSCHVYRPTADKAINLVPTLLVGQKE